VKRRTITVLLALAGLIVLTVVAVKYFQFERRVGISYFRYRQEIGRATAYRPACRQSDSACTIWALFRGTHPFPYQSIAAQRSQDGRLIIIISEPPPAVTKRQLDQLVKVLFDKDLIFSQRLRWYIGTDGWVEDLVLTLNSDAARKPDLLGDPVLRDRIALLNSALFGTSYGGDLEAISARRPSFRPVAANIHVSPREISTWLRDNRLAWHPIDELGGKSVPWSTIQASGARGAYASDNDTMVLLTFPANMLSAAKHNANALESLRIPFRKFAVASDCVFGGVWTDGGQVAIVAKIRTEPFSILPPLRFETFVLLAAQSTDELAQSYERTAIFAGKLYSGEYFFKDWAPAYLSTPLIDTEFGALLNITDQILKSWSESGHVDYLYFTYPKPADFPFGRSGLLNLLEKKTGAESVLYNWNTAGSAVIVKEPSLTVLTVKQTGALPVTYGANGVPKQAGGQDLYTYEDKAYAYFAGLRDPNLARVVQYTVIYQLFRAVAKSSGTPERASGKAELRGPGNAEAEARQQAQTFLSELIKDLLDAADSGKLTRPPDLVAELKPQLEAFRAEHPEINNLALSRILADRLSPEARQLQISEVAEIKAYASDLEQQEQTFDSDIKSFNALVLVANNDPEAVSKDKLMQMRSSLEKRAAALKEGEDEFRRKLGDPDGTTALRTTINELVSSDANLDEVRSKYIEINKVDPIGAIKTPSTVLSWRRKKALVLMGGHNLDANAVHFQATEGVHGLVLEKQEDGTTIVKYNPAEADSVEGHSADIARAIEHDGEHDPAALGRLTSGPVDIRAPSVALELNSSQIPAVGSAEGFGRLGARVYDAKAPFVTDLKSIAGKNECCVFVAESTDGDTFIAALNDTPPPPALAVEIRDTPSLVEYVGRLSKSSDKPLIFLNEPESMVRALALNFKGGLDDSFELAKVEAATEHASASNSRQVEIIMQRDLNAQTSELTLDATDESHKTELARRLAVPRPVEFWSEAKVTELDHVRLENILRAANWDTANNGTPAAYVLSFGSSGQSPRSSLEIIAGLSGPDAQSSKLQLLSAEHRALAEASRNRSSVAQFYLTVRNHMKMLPRMQLQRFFGVLHDNDTTILFTGVQRIDKGVV
jgi:hypothetical protein